MVHSSTNASSGKFGEISWYYVQPGFKLITFRKMLWALALFAFILFVIGYFFRSLLLDSPWALVIVPAAAIFVIWVLLALQPHRQIFYRIDKFGVFCEYRSSASPLASSLDFCLSLLCALLHLKNVFYLNKHSSQSRMFDWKEVVSVREDPYWKKITLQAGLHGHLNLWANADNYNDVLTLVREYVSKERSNYD